MSGNQPHDLPNSKFSRLVDPDRLAALAEQAIRLRDQGEPQFMRSALAELNDQERMVYEKPLTDLLVDLESETEHPTWTPSEQSEQPTIDLNDGKVTPPSSGGQPTAGDQDKPVNRRGTELLPEKIGKFRIKGELGRGAFGVVYLGYDDELQRNVAVKVSLVADEALQERLRVEASKLAQVESPGIVPVYHIGKTDDGKFYIVQKYIQGMTLRDVIRSRPLSPLIAVALMREIALGLEPAHSLDILHRDLKPDNILIEENGRSWIADFGLAISEDEQVAHRRELAGTPPYMPPEQIKGRVDFLDPRSDIWALGVMFYELLTGKLPFNGKDRKTLAEQICELDPRPLHQRAPGHLTESMNKVFLRCCAKQPSDRYATVGELADALDELIAEGLSDVNIYGEPTLDIGECTAEYMISDPQHRSTRRATRRASTQPSRRNLSTKANTVATRRSESRRPSLFGFASMVATVVVGLAIAAVAGQRFYSQPADRSEMDPSGSGPPAMVELAPTAPSVEEAIRTDAALAAAGTVAPMTPAEVGASETLENKVDLGDGSKDRPWIVAPEGNGTHTTLESAVASASPGDFIRVMPGLYRRPLRITVPVTIEGQPPKSGKYPCVIENDESSPIAVDCPTGTVTLRSFEISGKGHRVTQEFNPIEITGGTLKLESCALETRSHNCVKVRNDAALTALACRFLDSAEFAVSAKDFSTVSLTGCDFLCSGVEVTGGTGTIQSCKFYGDAGVNVANNLIPVEVRNCLLEENAKHGLLATDGGNLAVFDSTVRDSKLGVWATNQPMTADAPNPGKPGVVKLNNTKFEDCTVTFKVDGGILSASDDCQVTGGQIALGVSSGEVTLTDVLMSKVAEKAIVMYDGGEVRLRDCTIAGCGETAIKLSSGTLVFEGGVIQDYAQYGIMIGDKPPISGAAVRVGLKNVEVTSSKSKFAGILAWAGRVDLIGVTLDGASYGIYAEGPNVESGNESAQIEIRALETSFKNQSEYALVALGKAVVTLDRQTLDSVNAGEGLKVVPPAQVIVDERKK